MVNIHYKIEMLVDEYIVDEYILKELFTLLLNLLSGYDEIFMGG